jgi:hypothetical protein
MGIPIHQLPPAVRAAMALAIPTKPARAKAGTGAHSTRKRRKLAERRGIDSAAFLDSLAGRWLTRWRSAGGPVPEREHVFHPSRHWRFDFAWPEAKVAVEIDGGTWTGGAHSRGKGQANDAEKANAAACMGWVVLRWTSDMVEREAGIAEAVELVRSRAVS